MAHFTQHAGAAGTWENSGPVLEVQVGERAYFRLFGGGPRDEKLLIGAKGRIDVNAFYEEDSGQLNTRLIYFVPAAAGEYEIHALHPETYGDYAKSLKVVVRPSTGRQLNDHVIVCADSGLKYVGDQKRRSYSPKAEVVLVPSPERLFELLVSYINESALISKLEFITHGNEGFIGFPEGSGYINTDVVRAWARCALDRAFAGNAAVFFHGCNIADGEKGEAFLEAFGETFLKKGGRVGASTGYGRLSPGKDNYLHNDGHVKRVLVDPGGRIKERHLFDADTPKRYDDDPMSMP